MNTIKKYKKIIMLILTAAIIAVVGYIGGVRDIHDKYELEIELGSMVKEAQQLKDGIEKAQSKVEVLEKDIQDFLQGAR